MVKHWEDRFRQYLQAHPLEDKSHDISHFQRVFNTAQLIMKKEGGNELVLLTASYFHDIVSLPKNHPNRGRSSVMAAKETIKILSEHFPDFPQELYPETEHAISAHSFSAGIKPETLEAQIVQDADRIEALGAIGLARVFYVAGMLRTSLFDSEDPFAEKRKLDDKTYALDHFQQKLLKLPATMQTTEGKRMAHHNAAYLVEFMAKLSCELAGNPYDRDQSIMDRFGREMDESLSEASIADD